MWSSASGMQAQQTNLDVIANNLANVNTPGFKKQSVHFEDLIYETIKAPGALLADGSNAPTGLQIGHGSRPASTSRSFSQGSLQNTGKTLDVAIQGDGFFKVTLPDGTEAYTRDGAFKLNADGDLVTSAGFEMDAGINIPEGSTAITFSRDGTVSFTSSNGQLTNAGEIQIAIFPNAEGLRAIGENLYVVSEASGDEIQATPGEDGSGTLVQGFLELSNVQVVEEMVRMINAQRAYEVNSKAIQASDEMLGQANNLKR